MRVPINVRLWLSVSIAVFIVSSALWFLESRLVLWPLFDPTASSAPRPENIWVLRFWAYLGRLIFSLAFVLIFAGGYKGKPGVGEGLRFGLLLGALLHLPSLLINIPLTSQPETGYLITRCILDIVQVVLLGVLANIGYRPPQTS